MKSYHDIAGDGGSDVLGQVLARRERIARNLAGVRRLVAIASGKGGVGKSTLTMQLARTFRDGGARVAVLDADLNGPSQARLGGLPAAPPLPGERGLALPRTREGIGVLTMGSLFPEGDAVDFASLASGDSFTWRATQEFTVLAELLETADWGELDWLLVDLPPGAERTFQYAEFFGPAAAFVLVTVPSQLALGVVARSAAALARTPNRLLGLVRNMSGYVCGECGRRGPLFPEGEAPAPGLDLPDLGRVPFDPRLAAASDRGEGLPPHPDHPTVRALGDVARRLAEATRARESAK